MATTAMLTGNALTIQQWSVRGFTDVYQKFCFGRMFESGIIDQRPELDRAKRGDEITVDYTSVLNGIGTTEGGTLINNAEAHNLESQSMFINVTRHGVSNPNEDTIEQQRTNVNFENQSRKQLPEWHGSRLDASVFNLLAGNLATTITVDGAAYSGGDRVIVLGHNTATAPTTNRISRAGAQATDEALTSSDTMTLDIIDDALVTALDTNPVIQRLDGDGFDLYMHHTQARDLLRDTTGKVQFLSIEEARIQGGNEDIPLRNMNGFSMSPFGKYKNVRLFECSRVSQGVNSSSSAAISTVRRAVLCGKNGLFFGSNMGNIRAGKAPMKFMVELTDLEYIKTIEARMIYGLFKPVYDSEDLGVHVISTFAS